MAFLPERKRERRGDLSRLHEEVDDLFRSFLEPWEMPGMGQSRWPAIDIAETDDAFQIKAEVPGCKAEDIDISVHGNLLTISGEKKEQAKEKEKGYYHVESSYGSFRRDFNLSSDVDAENIDAAYKDGVLSIKLPKTEKTKPVKIKVKEQ